MKKIILVTLLSFASWSHAGDGVYGYVDSVNSPKTAGGNYSVDYKLKKISGLNDNCTPRYYRYSNSNKQKFFKVHGFLTTVFNGSYPVVLQYENCINNGVVDSPRISVNFFKTK